jgi:hypothetical protein
VVKGRSSRRPFDALPVPLDHQPIAVVLDLVDPIVPGQNRGARIGMQGSISLTGREVENASLRRRRCAAGAVPDQLHEHGHAGVLRLSERFKR